MIRCPGIKGGLPIRIFVITVLLLNAGCNSKSHDEVSSKTELERQTLDPKVALFLMKAEDSFHQGDFNTALVLTDSAAVYAPELADIPYLRGLIFTKLGQLNRAKVAFEEVVSVDPHYRAAWFKLGNNAFRRQQYGEAVSMYRKELKVAQERGREIDLERYCTTLLQLGRVYAELGKVDSAEQAYQRAISLDDSYAQVYSDLSALYEDNGDYPRAILYARKALELEPETVHHHYFLGLLLARTGQEEQAIGYLKTAIERRPWHPGAYYNLGQALMRLGRAEQAEAYLAAVDSLQSLLDLTDLARFTARANPDVPGLWTELARLLRRMGRYNEAMDAYQVALHLAPENVTIQSNMARLTLNLGDTTGAIRRYRALLRRNPHLADEWVNLGVVYLQLGQVEKARQAWQSALRYRPDDARARTWLERFSGGS